MKLLSLVKESISIRCTRCTAMGRVVSCCLAALLAGLFAAQAQGYHYAAWLDSVPKTGFYKIPISAEITARAGDGLHDFRIASGKDTVPYIITNEFHTDYIPGMYIALPILRSITDTNTTEVVIGNSLNNIIDNISLTMKNTAVGRVATLSGSNDLEKWFIIDEGVTFRRTENDESDSFSQRVPLPNSSYRYYRFRINNQHDAPLYVTGAKVYLTQPDGDANNDTFWVGKIANPSPSIKQIDSSDKNTYLLITNTLPYIVNTIELSIDWPFYNRNTRVHVLHTTSDSSGWGYPVLEAVLSSRDRPIFTIQPQKAAAILLVIENKDNPPLRIKEVVTRQPCRALAAWLVAGTRYQLLMGNTSVTAPEYDLAYFLDSMPDDIPILGYGNISPLAVRKTNEELPKNYNWLWAALVVAVAVLGWFTFSLINDTKTPQP